MKRCVALLVASVLGVPAGLLLLTVRADAHHSQTPFFDMTKKAEIQGVVVKWDFRNPHPLLHVEVTEPNGTKNVWILTFHNVAMMRRAGVDAGTFPVGMVVKASGPPSRVPGTHGMNAALVILPDGRQLKEGAGGGELDPAIYK
jgi:hypothetical protein